MKIFVTKDKNKRLVSNSIRNDSIIKLHFLLVILYFHSVKKPRQCPALPTFFALLKKKIPAYKSELY